MILKFNFGHVTSHQKVVMLKQHAFISKNKKGICKKLRKHQNGIPAYSIIKNQTLYKIQAF